MAEKNTSLPKEQDGKAYWIEKLGLIPHREGGYFTEVCHSDIPYGSQTLFSSILFLLGKGDISHLHVLEEDELWYYQGGEECEIVEIDATGKLTLVDLGPKSGLLQHLVKKGTIFGSRLKGESYTLVGCLVSPSFSYDHFRLLRKEDLPKMKAEDFQAIEEMLIE